jgi:hypothetical protein
MTNVRIISILTVCLLFSLSAAPSDATTVFGGSKIISVDQDQRTITFKTKEGQTWTLPVTNPDLLNPQRIAMDQPVTIEIDLDDRISNIVKLSDTPPAPRMETEDR